MNTLLTCIQNETAAMENLVAILQQEQAALTEAPTDAIIKKINSLAQQKNQLVVFIAELGKLRTVELLRLGFCPQETTISIWLQKKKQPECWQQLIEHTTKAKELNRVNGLLLAVHIARNQSMLDILIKNYRPGTNLSLYGANGQSSTQLSNTRGITA